MPAPVAVITGVTGQDGAYLSRHLLEKGYQVIGLTRPVSNPATSNLDRLELPIKSSSKPWFDRQGLYRTYYFSP